MCLSSLRVSLCVKQCHAAIRLRGLKEKTQRIQSSRDRAALGPGWGQASCAIIGVTSIHLYELQNRTSCDQDGEGTLALSPPRVCLESE